MALEVTLVDEAATTYTAIVTKEPVFDDILAEVL
jgi:hypothetical protein